MNRLAVACVLASCGVPAAPSADPEPRRMPAVDELAAHVSIATNIEKPPRPLYQAVARERLPPRHVITAVPSNLMDALAITADGKTAVSVDRTGAMRLWPTLDGKREPVVVPARTAVRLAVEREGDELVIAGLDAVGQLELVHTSVLGLETERIAVEAERPLEDVRIVGSRIVAVRDDQQLVAFDLHGVLVGELAPDPGERVASIQVQRGRALVVMTGATARGRWLDLGTTIAWGASTPPLAIDAKREVALAPDGRRLAAVTRNGQKIVILDLATGKVLRTTANVKVEDSATLAPIGFLDDQTLAEAAPFRVMVWQDGTTTEVNLGLVRVAAAGKLLADAGGSLSITTDAGTKYLGYAMPQLFDVVARADGLVALDGSAVVRLDRTMHVDRVYQLPPQLDGGWRTLTLLDDHHVLAIGGKGGYIVDLDSTNEPIQMPINGTFADYRRATQMIVLHSVSPTEYLIARFDSATGTFTTPIEVAVVQTFGATVTLLDPAVAHGNVAAITESVNGDRDVRITDVRLDDGEVVLGRRRFVKVDHQFWQDQAQLATMIHDVPQKTARSRDGELIAVLDSGVLTLRAKRGVEKWSRRIAGDAILWSSRGELLISGTGLGQLDLDTGVLTQRQCGWRFGLYDENTAFGVQGPGLCDARE